VVDAFPPVSLGGEQEKRAVVLVQYAMPLLFQWPRRILPPSGTEGYAAVSKCQLARRFRDHSEGN